ncbi:hypothetical protein BCY84_07368 [Trypanosoma cruzi cruzi]|nr:hypothetical protein BCY84_07368 [Trypanosoma cruzi cruzi]
MHIAVDLHASFVACAGGCVWRLLSSFVAMRREERECAARVSFSFGCDALRVNALSWAPCPVEGGMAGNFVAASWMDEGPLPLLPRVVGACSVRVAWWPRALAISLGCGNELGGDGGGCRLVVCELCGWACCLFLMFSALSRCIRCAPSLSLLLHCFPSVSLIS